MMILVRLIDLFVEYVKLLIGTKGSVPARVLAWLVLLAAVVAVIAVVAWGVATIPTLVDTLNGT
ncbi:hypothetical protein [Gordonia rhizosphera]|nr:hypothetical protein [Gordonia rhizosphera]